MSELHLVADHFHRPRVLLLAPVDRGRVECLPLRQNVALDQQGPAVVVQLRGRRLETEVQQMSLSPDRTCARCLGVDATTDDFQLGSLGVLVSVRAPTVPVRSSVKTCSLVNELA